MAACADYPYRSQQRHEFKYFEKQKAQPNDRDKRYSGHALPHYTAGATTCLHVLKTTMTGNANSRITVVHRRPTKSVTIKVQYDWCH